MSRVVPTHQGFQSHLEVTSVSVMHRVMRLLQTASSNAISLEVVLVYLKNNPLEEKGLSEKNVPEKTTHSYYMCQNMPPFLPSLL